jgi:hypothetical protein
VRRFPRPCITVTGLVTRVLLRDGLSAARLARPAVSGA